MYVFEEQQSHVRVYGSDGRLSHTIGRRGAGPGEFQRPVRLGVVGDTLWTCEIGRGGRLTLFDRKGTVLATTTVTPVVVKLHQPGSVGLVGPRMMRADRMFIGDMVTFTSEAVTGAWPHGPTDTIQVPRVLFDALGAVVDTLGWVPRLPPDEDDVERVQVGGQSYVVPGQPRRIYPVPLEDGHLVVDEPAVVTGADTSFLVMKILFSGDTAYHRRFAWSPRGFLPSHLDSLAWESARLPGGGYTLVNGVLRMPRVRPDSMTAFSTIRAAMKLPEYQRAVQQVRVGRDGAVWLRREDDGVSPNRWMILDAEGRPRGQLDVPRRALIGWSRGDVLWAAVPDDADVPWLVRYRIAG